MCTSTASASAATEIGFLFALFCAPSHLVLLSSNLLALFSLLLLLERALTYFNDGLVLSDLNRTSNFESSWKVLPNEMLNTF